MGKGMGGGARDGRGCEKEAKLDCVSEFYEMMFIVGKPEVELLSASSCYFLHHDFTQKCCTS